MEVIFSLQLLRFFAALSVVFYHMPIFMGLSIGVDIFFVISGFIIPYILEKNNNNFFVKRIIRILPLYWLLTLSLFISKTLFPNVFSYIDINLIDLFKSLFFIPIYSEIKDGIIYPIIMVGWTLNYEMFFYCLVSVSLFINKKIYIYLVLFSILFLFLLGNLYQDKSYIFLYISNSIILEFALGIILYLIYVKYNLFNNIYKIVLTVILIYISFTLFSNIEIRFLCYGLPSFFIVLFFLQINKFITKNNLINLMGLSSYALYLIHPYFLTLNEKIITYFELKQTLIYLSYIIYLIIVIGTSLFIYMFFEKNIINYLKKKLING
tara:strand:+ start:1712 stop:2680 length:969 start_codon:yes stop_codon:yes gene_type:complete